jgi:hypothetical protein
VAGRSGKFHVANLTYGSWKNSFGTFRFLLTIPFYWKYLTFRFIALEISTHSYLNLMNQYYPCYRADEYPEIDRPVTPKEFKQAAEFAYQNGLRRLG